MVALVLVGAAQAATPANYWTPAQASSQINKAFDGFSSEAWGERGRAKNAVCGGRGKRIGGRYSSFSCTVSLERGANDVERVPLYAKVRSKGLVGLCLSTKSLAAVPAACLRVSARLQPGGASDAEGDVRKAMTKRMTPEKTSAWQGFTLLDCFGAAGFYQCRFGEGVAGTANVLYLPAGPKVVWTSIRCADPSAFPGCSFPP